MKFVCLGYIDESRWYGLSNEERQRMMERCFDYYDELLPCENPHHLTPQFT